MLEFRESGELFYTEKYSHVSDEFIIYDRLGVKPKSDDDDFDAFGEDNDFLVFELSCIERVDAVCSQIEEKRKYGFLESIFEQIRANGGDVEAFERSGLIDADFKHKIKKLLLIIQKRNLISGARPYTNSEMDILIWELWYSDFLHSPAVRKPRGDGSSYSRSHLFGALENAVTYLGITDLPFLIACLHHDDYEDLDLLHTRFKREEIRDESGRVIFGEVVYDEKGDPIVEQDRKREFLTAYDFYKDDINLNDINLGDFCGDPQKYVDARLIEIHNWVLSVSKLKDLEDLDEEDLPPKLIIDAYNLYLFFEAIDKYGLMVALLKLSDRKHNTGTLDGLVNKSGEERTRFKVSVTAKVYGQVALKVAGCKDMYAGIIGDCFKFLKPNLVRDFELYRDDVMKDRFRDVSRSSGAVSKTKLSREMPVEFLFQQSLLKTRLDTFFAEDQKGDCVIDFLAVVPAKVGDSRYFDGLRIDDDNYSIISNIDSMDPMFEVVVLVNSPDAIVSTQRSLVSALSPEEVANLHKNNDAMTVFVPELNGRIRFRVVDTKSDLASQSGVVGRREKGGSRNLADRLPKIERAVLSRVVGLVRKAVDDLGVSAYADVYQHAELLARPTVTVFTKNGDEMSLPSDATVLDFAAAVHERVMEFMSGAVVRSDFGLRGRHVLPTYKLQDGDIVEVLTDGLSVLDLMHQYFLSDFDITGRKQMRKIMKRQLSDTKEMVDAGYLHVLKLESIFGISGSGLLNCLGKYLGYLHMYRTRDWHFARLDDNDDRGDVDIFNAAQERIIEVENEICMQIAELEVNALEVLSEIIEVGDGIDVIVQMPDVEGTEMKFHAEFGTSMVNFDRYKENEYFYEDDLKVCKLHIRMRLPGGEKPSVYELLKWIVEVSQRPEYRIQVVSDHFEKACLEFGDKSS